MLNKIVVFLSIGVTWLVFSGHFTTFFFVAGLISCLIAVWFHSRMHFFEKKNKAPKSIPLILKPYSSLYFIWLIREIINSSLRVVALVWQVEPKISPSTGCVSTDQTNDVGLTLFANSVTLTPGTVSVMVAEDQILVHALEEDNLEDMKDKIMDNKVSKLLGG
ncbi:MAG: Na+/H+ antiporter subunit E [Rickettsiales bacterium]|nr:Na+/H+ antiporter subunit E [Rickettsiales bacterium]